MLKKVVALSSTLVLTIAAVGTTVWAASGHHLNSSYNYQTSGNVTGFSAYSSNYPNNEKAVTGCMVTDGRYSWYLETIVYEKNKNDNITINYSESSITTNSGGTGVNIPRDRSDNTIYYLHKATASPPSAMSYHIDSYTYYAYQDHS